MTPADRVKLSTINRAVQALHEHVTENYAEFSHNPEGKLKAYIEESGGIDALANQVRVSTERGRSVKPPEEPEADPAEQTRSAMAKMVLDELKSTSKGLGLAKMKGPVRVGAEGLNVLLGRRESTGEVTILGSSNDPAHIEAVAASIASRTLSNVPPNLRMIAEIVRTQLFPPHALPTSRTERAKWLRTHYFEESDLWEEDLTSTVSD